jgi:hypothetical protein
MSESAGNGPSDAEAARGEDAQAANGPPAEPDDEYEPL